MDKNEKKEMSEGMRKTILRLRKTKVWKEGKWQPANLHAISVLCICCFIDALGKYIYGGKADPCKFKRFIENYMPNFYRALVNKAMGEGEQREFYLEWFYSDVRCGLVHEYFTKRKRTSGVLIQTKSFKNIVSGTRKQLIICLPKLQKEFLSILDKALQDIS